MARLTADDMIAIVRDCCGGETSETLSDTRILRFLNESYISYVSKYTPDQLSASTTVSAVNGTAEYTLSVSDVVQINDIVDDTNNFKLYPMSEEQYHNFTQGDAPSGDANYWYVSGATADNWKVYLWPTPGSSATLNVYYTKELDLVASPTATSPLTPRALDEAIYLKAAGKTWAQLGDVEQSDKYFKMARSSETIAKESIYTPSYIPQYLGSRVGRAR